MANGRKTAVLLLLIALGIGLLLMLKTPVRIGAPSPVAQRETSATEQRLNPIDLAPLYDQNSSFDEPGSWQAVPRGLQTIGNIPFSIAGLIQLWGEGPEGIGRHYRESVEAIPVNGKFSTLYILHASSFTTMEGTPIAEVVFRYADGTSATNEIRYGTDSGDWWQPVAEHKPLPTGSASKVIWRGDHPSLPDWVKSLRLFGTGIPNPKPDYEIKSIDLYSTKSRVTWVVLAMTIGNAGLMKVDPQFERDEAPVPETSLKLTTLDKDNGRPVPDVNLEVTLLTGRRSRFYGTYSTDEKGAAVIDLPPEHIKRISIEAVSTQYIQQQMTWNGDQGETILTNYTFKLSRTRN